ncbi:hypothetical protein GGF43_001028 [Coemansia sp. RSA 2618]|nr:hypothetical protein GGF43_001028 [Coemansia sp. RSA 2618]
MLDRCLRQFSALTDTAQWPMGALATATRKLVSTGQTASACQLLQTSASMDHRGFTQCLATLRTLDNPELKLAFVRDELSFRLYAHRLASYDTSPPAAAFFVPALSIRIDDPGIRDAVKQYYTDINGLLARAEPSTVERLVSEAGAWCFRLQNTEPIALLTHHLIASASDLSDDDCAGLLTAYLRTLRNFHMLHYTSRTQQAANKASRTTPRPLSATCVGQPGHSAYFTDIMSTFAATRTAILAEYLRRGIEPSIEALAILHSHLAACGHAAESHGLAATILPLIPPSATGQYAPGRLAAQAYYEHMLLSLAEQPRRMLQLFEHVLGHHNVDVPEFRHRMVDQTVTLYIRHGHFAGFGFFRLERPFIRLVNRPWFSTAYLNRVRPRFWALHMFLRQRRYVPRLRLHNKQLRIHKLDIYTMGVTAIPSPAKMKAQKVDLSIAPICTEDIHTALNIFLNSIPRNKLGPGIWSTDWMLKHQTKMVVSSGS